MNLDYKILWFEDNEPSFNAKKRLVKRVVENLGFNFPEPRNEINANNIETIDFKIYDLIIADLNLANGERGSVILNTIRDKGIYTEVIFYSSEGEDYVRKELSKFQIDGVYCADRANDDFIDKVEKVINTTIKKIQDLNNMRGLLMAETSDMDEHMREILLKFFSSDISSLEKARLHKAICSKITESLNGNLKQVEKICKEKNIEKLIKHPSFDASKMARTINELINEILKKEELEDLNSFFDEYTLEISTKRNVFGHVKESVIGGITVLVSHHEGREPIEFTEALCKEIRLSIKKHKGRLLRIQNSFE